MQVYSMNPNGFTTRPGSGRVSREAFATMTQVHSVTFLQWGLKAFISKLFLRFFTANIQCAICDTINAGGRGEEGGGGEGLLQQPWKLLHCGQTADSQ